MCPYRNERLNLVTSVGLQEKRGFPQRQAFFSGSFTNSQQGQLRFMDALLPQFITAGLTLECC